MTATRNYTETIVKNNMIANFMGLKKELRYYNLKTGNLVKKDTAECDNRQVLIFIKDGKPINDLQYHKSLDWIAPVYRSLRSRLFRMDSEEKINDSNRDEFNNLLERLSWATTAFHINSIYKNVVEGVEFYNRYK